MDNGYPTEGIADRMEAYVPHALAAIGAFEGHIIATKYLGPAYAGLGAALGAQYHVLSAEDWIRRYGVTQTYLWLIVIMMWLLALEYS